MKTDTLIQLLNQHKIVIPPIQRDYAQGRDTGKIPHIRERFLNSILEVIANENDCVLELDFVYGFTYKDKIFDSEEVSIFKPLDGQQRLTTLFLLHWYAAIKESKIDQVKETLIKFSYATRKSSREFCRNLIGFKPISGQKPVAEQIINQPWFFSTWKNDPTISSMLVVLNCIEKKFKKIDNIWEKLTGENPRIIFHLLPMEELGLPDDLYIKMNARGKELTDFEHFKSQFSEIISNDYASIFNDKIDKSWSELFWNIFKDKESRDIAREVDSGFLSVFWYITDLIIAKNKITLNKDYWLDIVKTVYHQNPHNVEFFFRCMDLFEKIEMEDPGYFDKLFYIQPTDFESGKTRIFFTNPQTNLFRKCAETYGYEGKTNNFSVGEQLLLYAIIYMEHNNNLDKAKIRKLRNIFASSEFQLRKDSLSTFLYNDVEKIIDFDQFSENSKLSKRQLEEEFSKERYITDYPDLKDTLYKLEDHHLLRGNVAILNVDSSIFEYAEQFHRIFQHGCNYSDISRAMMTMGDYSQEYGTLRRLGNKNTSTWRELFTQSEFRKGFDKTSNVLKIYLDQFIQTPGLTDKILINNYLSAFSENPDLPIEWRYYYIKYDSFRLYEENQTEGFYKWDQYAKKPYECTMLFRMQFNGRHWNPFLLELKKINRYCSLDNYGNDLQFTHKDLILMIRNVNHGFHFYAIDEFSSKFLDDLVEKKELNMEKVLSIKQNNQGYDLEDRIVKCNEFLSQLVQNLTFDKDNSENQPSSRFAAS